MEPSETRLILEGEDASFVIGALFWDDVVSWAIAHGWISDTIGDNHRWEGCREFSDGESRRLAEALDIIGGNLILESTVNVADEFIAELSDALLTLQRFAESGGFRVRPLNPKRGES